MNPRDILREADAHKRAAEHAKETASLINTRGLGLTVGSYRINEELGKIFAEAAIEHAAVQSALADSLEARVRVVDSIG